MKKDRTAIIMKEVMNSIKLRSLFYSKIVELRKKQAVQKNNSINNNLSTDKLSRNNSKNQKLHQPSSTTAMSSQEKKLAKTDELKPDNKKIPANKSETINADWEDRTDIKGYKIDQNI